MTAANVDERVVGAIATLERLRNLEATQLPILDALIAISASESRVFNQYEAAAFDQAIAIVEECRRMSKELQLLIDAVQSMTRERARALARASKAVTCSGSHRWSDALLPKDVNWNSSLNGARPPWQWTWGVGLVTFSDMEPVELFGHAR